MICAQHTRRATPRRAARMPVRSAIRFSWPLTAQLRCAVTRPICHCWCDPSCWVLSSTYRYLRRALQQLHFTLLTCAPRLLTCCPAAAMLPPAASLICAILLCCCSPRQHCLQLKTAHHRPRPSPHPRRSSTSPHTGLGALRWCPGMNHSIHAPSTVATSHG